jgi:hypothetical protein
MYEPFIIANKNRLPRYDERFRGYGWNKIQHLYEIAARGAHFIVLPHVFICGESSPLVSSSACFGELLRGRRVASYRALPPLPPAHAHEHSEARRGTSRARSSALWDVFKGEMKRKHPGFVPIPSSYGGGWRAILSRRREVSFAQVAERKLRFRVAQLPVPSCQKVNSNHINSHANSNLDVGEKLSSAAVPLESSSVDEVIDGTRDRDGKVMTAFLLIFCPSLTVCLSPDAVFAQPLFNSFACHLPLLPSLARDSPFTFLLRVPFLQRKSASLPPFLPNGSSPLLLSSITSL